jgi:hypothetical protein
VRGGACLRRTCNLRVAPNACNHQTQAFRYGWLDDMINGVSAQADPAVECHGDGHTAAGSWNWDARPRNTADREEVKSLASESRSACGA